MVPDIRIVVVVVTEVAVVVVVMVMVVVMATEETETRNRCGYDGLIRSVTGERSMTPLNSKTHNRNIDCSVPMRQYLLITFIIFA